MRYALLGLTLAALLAGCAGEAPAPLPTSAVIDAAPTDIPATDASVTLAPEGEATPLPPLDITMPPPGVIVTAAVTDEPPDGPGFDVNAPFESLIFQQTGGPNNLDLLIEIDAAGARRNGSPIVVTPEEISAIDQKIKAVDFFDIVGQFTVAGGPGSDQYRYRLSVQQDGAGRSINAQDGYTPPALLELFALIAALGA